MASASGPETAINELKQQKYAPIYLITGDEGYFIDQVSDYMEHNIVAEDCKDFDQKIVYGRDVTVREVINLSQQYPMLSPYKLVMVKEAQDLDSKGNDYNLLATYIEKAPPTSILVLCYRHKSLDKRTKLYQTISKKGKIYEYKKLSDYAVKTWIGTYVKAAGYSITEEMAMLIADTVGNDLSKIVCELQKVFIVLPKGEVINANVVEKYIGISKDYNVFELQNAIGARDVVRCNRIVNYVSHNSKEMPIQLILPMLYRYFINLMICHQDPSAIKASPYAIDGYRVAAGRYPLGKLATCIGYLHEADLLSKGVRNTGTITEGEILKELVFKIIH